MDFIREIVGGPKKRYRQFGYNLDLTYITDRVIAMAFPASGLEKLYRNSVDSIRQFLQNAHQNKYITINISGRNIEEEKLQNVITYQWEDHKTPPFDTLFLICQQVVEFLIGDPDRVAVFHCNHGKGRTGTIICCFLLYLGVFTSTEKVMEFYAVRRFQKEGYGVTQPCQIKYTEYFLELLQTPSLSPQVMVLSEIKFMGQFSFKEPYVKIWRLNGEELVYSSKETGEKFYQTSENGLSLATKQQLLLAGDIIIEIKENKTIGTNSLISYVFNTAFLHLDKEHQEVIVPLKELSPLGHQKLSNFGSTFQMVLSLHFFCLCGLKADSLSCQGCSGVLKEESLRWNRIRKVLKKREVFLPKGQEMVYGKSHPKSE